MKTSMFSTKTAFALILSFVVSFAAFADKGNGFFATKEGEKIKESEKISYSIYPILNTNKIRVAYQKYGAMPVSVRIYDSKMNLLYTDTQKRETYIKRNYDLDRIGSGEYVVKIEAGEYTTVQRIQVGQTQEQEFAAYLSPQLSNNKVRVAFQHATAPVKVQIFNEDGTRVFEKRMIEQNFSSLFNLSPLKKGKYTVIVSSEGSSTRSTYEL